MCDFYRQDCAKRKLRVLNLLTGQKSAFSPRRGDSSGRLHLKLGVADGHVGPLGCANRCRGGNPAQKYILKIHFLVKDRPHGQTPWPISKSFRGFYAHHYPAKAFQIWRYYRMPQTILNLLTGQKSAFSPRRGDSLHRFMWNLAIPRGTWVCLTARNFTPIGSRGGNAAPKIWKISTFW